MNPDFWTLIECWSDNTAIYQTVDAEALARADKEFIRRCVAFNQDFFECGLFTRRMGELASRIEESSRRVTKGGKNMKFYLLEDGSAVLLPIPDADDTRFLAVLVPQAVAPHLCDTCVTVSDAEKRGFVARFVNGPPN